MVELFSGIVGAIVAGIVAAVIAFVRAKREDGIRREEQALAAKVRQEEEKRAERLRDSRWRRDQFTDESSAARARADAQRREAMDQAKSLLLAFAELEAAFGAQRQRTHDTYAYNQDLTQKINYQLRLVPNRDLRRLADLSIRVIDHTWILVQVGEVEDGMAAQRSVLRDAMDAIAVFLTDGTADPTAISTLESISADADRAFEESYPT
ncbi:hypothetical protein ABH923_003226 [Leifsonia sp. EB41]|uniref:hypothetical protein n=1 Tax=Leifsonia sp. EB41 TaxID=3156260 RepID=UPI003513DE9F